ncbi:Bis(5'-nucleosyl)-tetraphosphatase, symmetrical [Eubacterium plexicaudatum ASF492]|uniref:Calcineurin-like phosphoesterase domain-containing protein n=1 Tax=Eubacterium plexicaudatum ASF492 TaxID=1235802 RepID=N2A2K9_9FIRM|nr:Bis(5'-nucleosyl)-tetraphosphatase, symmetrical [Eubacterium plexicaudatum ASF492]
MAYYVCSDIHGRLDRYRRLLETIRLSAQDTLFVLGDVIDRNPDGIAILQDMIDRDNVELFLGNHELFLYETIADRKEGFVTDAYMKSIWCSPNNGGSITYQAFCKLAEKEKRRILKAVQNSTLLRIVDVNGIKYHLSHSFTLPVPELSYYRFQDVPIGMAKEVVWKSVFRMGEYHARYQAFDPKMRYIVGHVPVQRVHRISRIFKYCQITDIDCGCAYSFLEGNSLACLRLDDMEEYYIF